MDAILTDPHLDTVTKICILMNMVVVTLQYVGDICEVNAKFAFNPAGNSADGRSQNCTRMLEYD